MPTTRRALAAFSLTVLAVACGKEEPKKEPPAPPPAVSTVAPKVEAPKPAGPPTLLLTDEGLSVNGERVEASADKVVAALKEKPKIAGEPVKIVILRATKIAKVDGVFTALRRLGAASVVVGTQGRDGKEAEATFPLAATAPACAPIAAIQKDMSIAVWTLGGGASKRLAKGMAGPDITQGADALVKGAERCEGAVAVIAAEDPVPFGLAFDLSRAALAPELKGKFVGAQLLGKPATPGRKTTFGD